MTRLMLAVIFSFGILGGAWAVEPETLVIKKETADFDLQIKYPQGFATKNIDKAIQNLITSIQKEDKAQEEKVSIDVPGKNSLYVDYKIKFQNRNALSILFSASAYARGAAHPANSVKTLNFLNNEVVTANQLFKTGSNYFPEIVKFCRAALTKKQISDQDWIINGTKSTPDNYKNWFFTKEGLAIVFDTYQVAAYVYGPQTVIIPKAKLADWLRPEVSNALWGNQ